MGLFRSQCPACRMGVPREARKCGHCGSDLPTKIPPTQASMWMVIIGIGLLVLLVLVIIINGPPISSWL